MIDNNTKCYRHGERNAAVSCQRCDRPICTTCMNQASVGFHCPECVRSGGQKVVRASQIRSSRSGQVVTIGIIALCVAAFIAQQVTGRDSGIEFDVSNEGVLWGPAVQAGEYWRVVSSAFLHGGGIHIMFNMYLLWIIGNQLEAAVGRLRYVLVYASGLLAASFAVLAFNFEQATLGASGAVLGLAGAIAGVYIARGLPVRQIPGIEIVLINLGLPLIIPGISFWGHFGGVVGGFIAGWILMALPEKFDRTQSETQLVAGVVCVAWFVLCLVAASSGGVTS